MKMQVKTATEAQIAETKNWGTWIKEPSVFPWEYDSKETCYILAGKATVTDNEGHSISFKTGDWVEFERGLVCTWQVFETIKKKYFFE